MSQYSIRPVGWSVLKSQSRLENTPSPTPKSIRKMRELTSQGHPTLTDHTGGQENFTDLKKKQTKKNRIDL